MRTILKNFKDKFGRKPRVLILADVPGWAYDINSRGIQKALSDDFEIAIAYLHHGDAPDPRPEYFDIYHICCWVDVVDHWHIDPRRIIKEVSSHRWEESGPWGPLTPKQFCAKYLADSSVITTTSKRLHEIVGNIRPNLLTPNGVSDLFRPGPQKKDKLTFGWVGNSNDPCKGLRDILQPASYRLISLQIAPGNMAHEEMVQFYQKIDVLCVASTKEGEPLPLLEGMRCGCFPICTDVGIVPELVRHEENGLIVERSPEAFRKAFKWCIEHPDTIRSAGQANSEFIHKTRSWDRLKGAWRRAWCEALKHHTPKISVDSISKISIKSAKGISTSNIDLEDSPCERREDKLFTTAISKKKTQNLSENLSFTDWNKAIVGAATPRAFADRAISGKVPEWISVILEESHQGESCLELGSGSGILSSVLARQGRKTFLLDFSADSLAFSKKLYEELRINGEFILADVLKPLPFEDAIFDCVWSSGLLEHFSDVQIEHIVSESARISKNIVLSLVPNASSIPYRIGKWHKEQIGDWKYGYEDPKYSMVHFFKKVNLHNIREYSVSWKHALKFMTFNENSEFCRIFELWYNTLSANDIKKLNQGYLLATIGSKKV